MPNTAVFLLIFDSPLLLRLLVLGFDVQFAGYLVFARHFGGLGLDSLLLVLGPYRPLKRDLAVLRDDFHIVGISGQGFVFHNGLPNLLCDVAVGTILLLLIGRGFVRAAISLIHLGVVSWWRQIGRTAPHADRAGWWGAIRAR